MNTTKVLQDSFVGGLTEVTFRLQAPTLTLADFLFFDSDLRHVVHWISTEPRRKLLLWWRRLGRSKEGPPGSQQGPREISDVSRGRHHLQVSQRIARRVPTTDEGIRYDSSQGFAGEKEWEVTSTYYVSSANGSLWLFAACLGDDGQVLVGGSADDPSGTLMTSPYYNGWE